MGVAKSNSFLNGSVQKTPEKISLHTVISYHTSKSFTFKSRESLPFKNSRKMAKLQPLIYANSQCVLVPSIPSQRRSSGLAYNQFAHTYFRIYIYITFHCEPSRIFREYFSQNKLADAMSTDNLAQTSPQEGPALETQLWP